MRGYVDTSVGQVHYQRAGDAGPDVLLLHCYNTTSRLYERALPLLGRRFRAWALDAPGTGMSDTPPVDDPTFPDVASWISEAMDRLGIESAILGGLHTGARMAVEVARLRGVARTPALVLTGSGPLQPMEPRPGLSRLNSVAIEADGSQWNRALERYRSIFPSQETGATEADGWLQHIYLWSSMDKLDKRRFNWAGRVPDDWEALSFYRDFPNPVLWLNTSEDCFSADDEQLAPLNANAQLRMIEGIGPHLMLRDPERYVGEIEEFLESVGVLASSVA